MKYVQYVNTVIKEQLSANSNIVLYGQNIDAGSSLSGLTRGFKVNEGFIINTQNSENLLVGVGFGLMLNNISSVFFMKQMDFLLLGIDHLVNTYNIIRQTNPNASFTVFPVTVDSGFEGPQSALNNFDDFCSIAGVEGYSFTNKQDTQCIISKFLFKPGFRILSTGQKLLREEVLDLKVEYKDPNCKFFQYNKGNNATIICFNQSLKYGIELRDLMLKKSLTSSLFSINSHLNADYEYIFQDISLTRNLIIIDDTKSKNRLSNTFLTEVLSKCSINRYKIVYREPQINDYFPREDSLEIDYKGVINEIFIKI
jgi:pyruvate/2-oxoglutarate/acetoin dehydrogenase E1 component